MYNKNVQNQSEQNKPESWKKSLKLYLHDIVIYVTVILLVFLLLFRVIVVSGDSNNVLVPYFRVKITLRNEIDFRTFSEGKCPVKCQIHNDVITGSASDYKPSVVELLQRIGVEDETVRLNRLETLISDLNGHPFTYCSMQGSDE